MDVLSSLDFSRIDWSPHSFEDPGGRLFRRDGKLYRALRGASARAFLHMEQAGLLADCSNWGLVPTRRADFTLPNYDLVIEHEVIRSGPVVSEWTPSMLIDAALRYCDLSSRLAEYGLQLQDSHGWNFMFRHTEPIYVDFSSIIPLGEQEPWKPFQEFLNCFLHPIEMIARRQADYAFFLLGTQNWVAVDATLPYLFPSQFRVSRKIKRLRYARWERVRRRGGQRSVHKLATILKRQIDKPIEGGATRWSTYSHDFPKPNVKDIDTWNEKQRSVHRILESAERGTLLDLGCNTGWYSILAEKMGFDVLSMDSDRASVDELYRRAKLDGLNITPIAATPFSPIIPHGPRFYESLEARFQADHTLMLALIHHLFFKQGYEPTTVVSIAAAMTRKTLVLEYVPLEDYWIQQWNITHRTEEYALDIWLSELRKHFESIGTMSSEYSHRSSQVQRTLIVATR